MDILIIKLGALGDVINTLPLAVRLKEHFDARIHWLVAPLSYPIVSNHTCVHRTIIFNKKEWATEILKVRRRLQEKEFDIVLDLQRILKSGLFAMVAKTKRRIGFDKKRCKEMTWMLPYERIPESDPSAHMLLQYLEFADYLGVSFNSDIRWDIPVPDKMPQGLPEKYIVLNIGATKPANRWTPEGFAILSDAIRQRFNILSVLTGGPEDTGMAEHILSINNAAINLVGKTSVPELTSVLNNSMCVVTCDTGPMHLAVALGKEVIALFGPANPGRTGPFKGEVIQKAFDCIPCNKKQCDEPKCMEQITYDDVMRRLEKLIV